MTARHAFEDEAPTLADWSVADMQRSRDTWRDLAKKRGRRIRSLEECVRALTARIERLHVYENLKTAPDAGQGKTSSQ
jgi:hypothetical protein